MSLLAISDSTLPIRVAVTGIGHVARRTLQIGAATRVGPVFGRSFYLQTNGAWLCLAGPSVAMGPLILRCDVPAATDWGACGVREGTPVIVGDESVRIGSRFLIAYAGASLWAPPPAPRWTRQSLRDGIGATATWIREHPVDEGLGVFILRDADMGELSVVAERARAPIASLRRWLAAALANPGAACQDPPDAVGRLIGLGPGLTPSGDDFLGGAMIALHILGRPELGELLYENQGNGIAECGNPISAAHLRAAAEGAGSEWLHAAINAILAPDAGTLTGALADIDRVGHTSGRDMLAGVVTVLGLAPEVSRRRPRKLAGLTNGPYAAIS